MIIKDVSDNDFHDFTSIPEKKEAVVPITPNEESVDFLQYLEPNMESLNVCDGKIIQGPKKRSLKKIDKLTESFKEFSFNIEHASNTMRVELPSFEEDEDEDETCLNSTNNQDENFSQDSNWQSYLEASYYVEEDEPKVEDGSNSVNSQDENLSSDINWQSYLEASDYIEEDEPKVEDESNSVNSQDEILSQDINWQSFLPEGYDVDEDGPRNSFLQRGLS